MFDNKKLMKNSLRDTDHEQEKKETYQRKYFAVVRLNYFDTTFFPQLFVFVRFIETERIFHVKCLETGLSVYKQHCT